MKRELKRQQTKKLLLDTTEMLIREKGCSQTTLNDIMQHSGLSKGAIFHYVKGKDELFALVLEASLEETNSRFFDAIQKKGKQFEAPMQEITNSLSMLTDSNNVTNRILVYLLGKSDQPAVSEVVQRFYDQAVRMSKQWIAAGQESDVISKDVNADKTAELFVLVSYGFRLRTAINSDPFAFGISDFASLIVDMLKPKK
ncbi:TetR/AcrR family transcriptional regulator [Bacillus sp. 03113]|uniref:TetR/AcrR family transcriptional regulator n=1 Tax=Bacillus sp. 03113 TaxID=2578211 RepID=UPI001143D087|nr:TetR/AcrR family transcriptional regulator [Bacillus sp. 03113]